MIPVSGRPSSSWCRPQQRLEDGRAKAVDIRPLRYKPCTMVMVVVMVVVKVVVIVMVPVEIVFSREREPRMLITDANRLSMLKQFGRSPAL